MVDLDGLKKINDEQGHEVGDDYIKLSVNIIKDSIREKDSIIRMGGDEFLVILTETDSEGVRSVIERIRENMKKNNESNVDYKVSMSLGYATMVNGEKDVEDVIKEADEKMYEEKKEKKGI